MLTAAGYLSYLEEKCAPLLQQVGTSADCTQQVSLGICLGNKKREIHFKV